MGWVKLMQTWVFWFFFHSEGTLAGEQTSLRRFHSTLYQACPRNLSEAKVMCVWSVLECFAPVATLVGWLRLVWGLLAMV